MIIFFILSTVTGFLLGCQFPLLVGSADITEKNSSAGLFYSFDLFGGWLAAILVGTVLIPAGGFFAAGIFLALTKTASTFWWYRNAHT